MPELTSPPAQVVADAIVRTVELGVRITGAALRGETRVVFAELITDGPGRCPGCGLVGSYRDTTERHVSGACHDSCVSSGRTKIDFHGHGGREGRPRERRGS